MSRVLSGYNHYMATTTKRLLYYLTSQMSNKGDGSSADLLGLIHTLIKDHDERLHFFRVSVSGFLTELAGVSMIFSDATVTVGTMFTVSLAQFQEVFPVRFGARYCEDIRMLVETLLLQLDKLLSVPNLKQVTHSMTTLCNEDILFNILQYTVCLFLF